MKPSACSYPRPGASKSGTDKKSTATFLPGIAKYGTEKTPATSSMDADRFCAIITEMRSLATHFDQFEGVLNGKVHNVVDK